MSIYERPLNIHIGENLFRAKEQDEDIISE